MTDEFTLWYYGDGEDKGYPRKESRGDARKAFTAARKVATLDELIAGRKGYTARLKADGTERRFTKLPATWLRAECWADEDETPETPLHLKAYDQWTDAEKHATARSLRNGIPAANMRLGADIEGRLRGEGYFEERAGLSIVGDR